MIEAMIAQSRRIQRAQTEQFFQIAFEELFEPGFLVRSRSRRNEERQSQNDPRPIQFFHFKNVNSTDTENADCYSPPAFATASAARDCDPSNRFLTKKSSSRFHP